jgi:hypothetical protein
VSDSEQTSSPISDLSRRAFLRYTGIGVVGVAATSLLAACGSSKSAGSSAASSSAAVTAAVSSTGAASSAATTALSSAAAAGTPLSASAALAAVIQQLGIDPANAGKGATLKVGYIGPLSGPGQPYSLDQIAGLKSAVKVIPLLGGPTLDITYLDNKSGDAQAGISGVRQLTAQGVDLLFSSYVGDFGALYSPVASAKMFAIDAGGTSPIAWSHPYFWNAAVDWTQALPGQYVFLRKLYPNAKTVVLVSTDAGPALNTITTNAYKAAASAQGFNITQVIFAPQGNSDYSTALSKVQGANPDLVCLSLTNTVGNFMTQYLQAGLKAPVDGGVLNPVDLQVGGSAMDGVTTTSTYFFPKFPANPLSELLVANYADKVTDLTPNWNAGFFFQAAINMWELSTMCTKAGQAINGVNMNNQMLATPALHSPFGGSNSEVAAITYDASKHISATGTVNNCTIKGGKFYMNATNNLTGTAYSALPTPIAAA